MKIFKLLLFVATLSLTVSCSSDDDNETTAVNSDLTAQWRGESVEYFGHTEDENQNTTSVFAGTGYDIDYTLTFSENPNLVTAAGSYSIELTTTIGNQTITQNVPNLTFINDSDWSADGNQLTLTNDGETSVITITEITDSRLVLSGQDITTQSAGGFTQTSITNVVLTFTR